MLPDSFYLVAAALAGLAGTLLLALNARARRARQHCPFCGSARSWWRRATTQDRLCRPCSTQARYAARAGLWPVYQVALMDAWEKHLYGPALRRRVNTALFYADLAARFQRQYTAAISGPAWRNKLSCTIFSLHDRLLFAVKRARDNHR